MRPSEYSNIGANPGIFTYINFGISIKKHPYINKNFFFYLKQVRTNKYPCANN